MALLPRLPNPIAGGGRAPDRLRAAFVREVNGLRVSLHPSGEAAVTPLPGARVHASHVRAQMAELRDRGVRRVTTSALSPRDTSVWQAAGFHPVTALLLLRADLRWRRPTWAGLGGRTVDPRRTTSMAGDVRLRPARRREWAALAALDARAFAPQPGLGIAGLVDALAVTPSARVRVAGQPARGFAVSGHDMRCGYLQRLAVAPAWAGRGIGSALVADTLRWLHRRGAVEALVNTEAGNDRALALYERFGFTRQPEGLVVLACEL